jgi:hypothetical protein
MKIVYCRRCAYELADTAPTCLQCGAPQARVMGAAAPIPAPPAGGTRAIGRWLLGILVTGGVVVVLGLLWPVVDGLRAMGHG